MIKKAVYSFLTFLNSLYFSLILQGGTKEYFIRQKPDYLSQFVALYPQSISPRTTLDNKKHIQEYGAKAPEEFTFWAWRNCGILCIKMILNAKGLAKNQSIMDLTYQGIELGGYIVYEGEKLVDKGWFHHSLVALMKKYGVAAETKKWQSIESVAKDILSDKFVILSVFVPGRNYIEEDGSFGMKTGGKKGGHLLLATGLKMENKAIKGLYVHDPRGLANYQKDTYIPTHVLSNIFSNRTIVAK